MSRVIPFSPYKIDQKYGKPVSYGPHEGWDINGLGGGNTDCGTILYPLFVDSARIIFQSTSSSGYGKMIIIEVDTPNGKRWVRYAHLQEVLVKTGEELTENTPVAKMGSTGNSTFCHLHYDIFRKKPSSWRWFPKTVSSLHEYLIDPQEWITVYKDYETKNMPEEKIELEREKFEELVTKSTKFDELKAGRLIPKAQHEEEIKSSVEGYKNSLYKIARQLGLSNTDDSSLILGKLTEDQETAKKDKDFREKMLQKLSVESREKALGQMENLLTYETKYNQLVSETEKEKIQKEKEEYIELADIKNALQKIKTVDVDQIIKRLENIENRVVNYENKKETKFEISVSNRFMEWINSRLGRKP